MKILALETSSLTGSVAALVDGQLHSQAELGGERRTAQTLAPAILQQLEAAGWSPSEIDLVAVTDGPGSFTGLRIGVTTAKTLAWSCRAEAVAVNTLDVVAAQSPSDVAALWAVIDAHRGQLFTAKYRRLEGDDLEVISATQILEIEQWLAGLASGETVSGPGLSKVASRLPKDVQVVEQSRWTPQASTVGELAWRAFQQGRRNGVFALVPKYFRASAAEEKRQKR